MRPWDVFGRKTEIRCDLNVGILRVGEQIFGAGADGADIIFRKTFTEFGDKNDISHFQYSSFVITAMAQGILPSTTE